MQLWSRISLNRFSCEEYQLYQKMLWLKVVENWIFYKKKLSRRTYLSPPGGEVETNTSLLNCFCCWWRHCLLSTGVYFPLSFFVLFMLLALAHTIHLTLPHIFLPFVTLHLTFRYLTLYLTSPYILPYLILPYVLPVVTLPYLTISLTLHFALPYLTS